MKLTPRLRKAAFIVFGTIAFSTLAAPHSDAQNQCRQPYKDDAPKMYDAVSDCVKTVSEENAGNNVKLVQGFTACLENQYITVKQEEKATNTECENVSIEKRIDDLHALRGCIRADGEQSVTCFTNGLRRLRNKRH